jgi:hypothetical protein
MGGKFGSAPHRSFVVQMSRGAVNLLQLMLLTPNFLSTLLKEQRFKELQNGE